MNVNKTKIKIEDIKSVIKFITTVMRYVDRGKFELTKTECHLFCKNPSDQYSNTRLLLKTNLMHLDESSDITSLSISLNDFTSLKSSLSVIDVVEKQNTNDLSVLIDILYAVVNDQYIATDLIYKNKATLKLKTVNPDILTNYLSADLRGDIVGDWEFNLNPVNWTILLSKTSNIVNYDISSIYLFPKDQQVIVEIASRNSEYCNSVGLPIADKFTGNLPTNLPEIAISEPFFRMLNLLQVTDENCIKIKFNNQNKVFISESIDKQNDYFISCIFMCRILVGK